MSNPTLGNPPLALTLAQIKFNQVLTMENYANEIQDEFRRLLNFVYHKTQEIVQVTVTPQRGVNTAKTNLWLSQTSDNKTSLVLGDDSLIIETTEYPGFDDFVPNLKSALEIVKIATEIRYITRLGYRYINRIETNSQKPLDYYLNPQLLGFQFKSIENIKAVSRTEAIANTQEGLLRVHCMQFLSEEDASKNPLLPPDFKTQLDIKPVNTKPPNKYAFLDIDHFKEFESEPIDLKEITIDEVISRLKGLHQVGYDTFKSGVTSKALEEWR